MEERNKTNPHTRKLSAPTLKWNISRGEENASTWFLKSPKAHHRMDEFRPQHTQTQTHILIGKFLKTEVFHRVACHRNTKILF